MKEKGLLNLEHIWSIILSNNKEVKALFLTVKTPPTAVLKWNLSFNNLNWKFIFGSKRFEFEPIDENQNYFRVEKINFGFRDFELINYASSVNYYSGVNRPLTFQGHPSVPSFSKSTQF